MQILENWPIIFQDLSIERTLDRGHWIHNSGKLEMAVCEWLWMQVLNLCCIDILKHVLHIKNINVFRDYDEK
jgi:hypothetical protein